MKKDSFSFRLGILFHLDMLHVYVNVTKEKYNVALRILYVTEKVYWLRIDS